MLLAVADSAASPAVDHGYLYVVATLLPLLSFLLLFFGGRRWPGRTGGFVAVAGIGGAFLCAAYGFILYLNAAHGGHGYHASHDAKPAAASATAKAKHQDHPKKDEHGKQEDAKKEDAKKDAAGHDHQMHGHGGDHGHHGHHEQPVWTGSIPWLRLTGFGSDAGALELQLGYHIDGLAALMFLMVTFIAMLIHIFALGYMSEELQPTVDDHQAHVTRKGRYPRFFMWFSLFCFSMLNLILANNLFQIFISWELVGICSFGLIGFYYERQSASNAANKAFITNRVGDAGFIIGLLILWSYCGTLNFGSISTVKEVDGESQRVFSQVSIFDALRAPAADTHGEALAEKGQVVRVSPAVGRSGRQQWQIDPNGSHVIVWDKATLNGHFHGPMNGKFPAFDPARDEGHGSGMKAMPYWMLVLAGLGIFLGCVGKSAQFPLQVWLPDAMEGPTPVSALVHSATMVAAGVYLVGRVFPMFVPEVLMAIAYTGAITAFVAATIAIVQTDIKKVLAYSTVSQLGFMMLALGVGGWVAGLFHLITHAFFKALLFLCSGAVIYGCHHEQEMTKMGGLFKKMPITAITMLVGVLAICGTPLFSGWYSKDVILVNCLSFISLNPQHALLFIIPLVSAAITAFYMFRLWFMTFTGEPKDHHVHDHAHEPPRVMTVPLILLAICALVVAWGPEPWDVQGSAMEHYLHHGAPASLQTDTGLQLATVVKQADTTKNGGNFFAKDSWLHAASAKYGFGPHDLAGLLALLSAGLGVLLAFIVYYWRFLDPADTKDRFPAMYELFGHKWYFDELYSVLIVRPGIVVGHWARWFDANVIDGVINGLGRCTVLFSKLNGRFDLGMVDGLVNLTAKVIYAVGDWLRGAQTGLIRNYVLFMAVAAVGIFAVLSYVIALAG